METFQERIALVLKEQKITAAELIRVAGGSKGNATHWTKGPTRTMEYEPAARIRAKYGYSIDWLMKGVKPKMAEDTSPGPDIKGRYPLISSIVAGKWSEAKDNFRPGDAEDWLPFPGTASPDTYCLRVEGDSMTAPYGKSYPEGSIIFVDPDKRSPVSGQRIVAKLKGEEAVTFKVFVREANRVWLKPLNPTHPPIMEEFSVLGTVIGKWEGE